MLNKWIASYDPKTATDLYNAKREIAQEIVLAGLYRGRFFEKAVFYGGTALRVLHDLDRYSEDLDFSLLVPDMNFTLEPYLSYIINEFKILGLTVEVKLKEKRNVSAIQSAFLKDSSSWSTINIQDKKADQLFPSIKIKIEVDRDPPLHFQTAQHLMTRPFTYMLSAMDISSLFAGKMHATLFRQWKRNVKGRDWYDLVWYISNGSAIDLNHFKARSTASGNWPKDENLTKSDLIQLFENRVAHLDIEMAKRDIMRFIPDPERVDIWSKDFFLLLFKKIKITV